MRTRIDFVLMDDGEEPAAAPSAGGAASSTLDDMVDQEEFEHESHVDKLPVDVVARRHMGELRRDMTSMREEHAQAFAKILKQLAELKNDRCETPHRLRRYNLYRLPGSNPALWLHASLCRQRNVWRQFRTQAMTRAVLVEEKAGMFEKFINTDLRGWTEAMINEAHILFTRHDSPPQAASSLPMLSLPAFFLRCSSTSWLDICRRRRPTTRTAKGVVHRGIGARKKAATAPGAKRELTHFKCLNGRVPGAK